MRVLLFGSLAERLGREIEAEIPPEGCQVAELRQALALRGDAFSVLANASIRAAVDQVLAEEQQRILPHQEVAFFSAVSGG